jgi:hypothetical protein
MEFMQITAFMAFVYEYLSLEPNREARDQLPKILFEAFTEDIISFLQQCDVNDILGSYLHPENIEIINPSLDKLIADFAFRTTKNQIVLVEFVSTRPNSCMQHFLTKAANLELKYDYSVEVIVVVVFIPLLGGVEEEGLNAFISTQKFFFPYVVYLSKLKEQINLDKIAQAIDNSEIIDNCTLIKLCFLPTLYSRENTIENITVILDIAVKSFSLIKDMHKKIKCFSVFFGFFTLYYKDYCEYLLSKQGEGKMKLLGDMIEEQFYNPFMEIIAAKDEIISANGVALSEKDEIISAKDVALSEKDEIISDYAIKLLKEGKSHKEVARITKLPLEKVEKLSRDLD